MLPDIQRALSSPGKKLSTQHYTRAGLLGADLIFSSFFSRFSRFLVLKKYSALYSFFSGRLNNSSVFSRFFEGFGVREWSHWTRLEKWCLLEVVSRP